MNRKSMWEIALKLPDAQIREDLLRLSELTNCIRTYSAAGAQGKVTRIAGALGFKVLQGIWLNRNLADNRREIEAALRLARQHPGIIEAFIVAGADLFELGQTFVLVGSVITGLITVWLFAWTFARSLHVERRLAAGLEIDEPKLSILANFRDSRPLPSRS